ncbi:helix-turn-helix domain-containing protein [Streptomyces inhibens]|uniref:helix-turn-helix domain-containing protein n=1 Tax=Streptomyces inhibens TaxID=2293571 RepID=UPI001EE77AC8|nr:helix-turn-helix transcriptional regulator [Streptomyces inhibens]UKY47398.1 helix-turn-helix domain-containing protein [Streptomyces inhibens]UKY55000.1 helix-turn-helix domain-containing protein [Streptomyces inhibens]
MSDFDAIDSLLAAVGPHAGLPAPDARRELRERARLSKAQVARALGVSPSTVGGWESGREPVGETRTKYAYLLDGLSAKLAAETQTQTAATPLAEQPAAPDATTAAAAPSPDLNQNQSIDEEEALTTAEPCVLCGRPAHHRVAGFVQHLDPADCRPTTATAPAPASEQPTRQTPNQPSRTTRPVERAKEPARRAFQKPSGPADLIHQTVQDALAEHQGDVDTATTALLKKAIPDAMRLLDETRKGARYDVIAHPWIPDILKKQTSRGADQIWEARPKWTRHELPPGSHEVTALDINGAYLSALKTHLPLGQLEHSAGPAHDRRRAGVHLITPPPWDHEAVLPNPIGNRDEPGPLWVTEPTLRLLLRLSGPKYGLCAPPEIHESYTSGATENLLEKFRVALKDARDTAITKNDEVTLEYVKAMYSKFVSTMGESNYNRELYRPDWMHIIRSQAFANLWMKAFKAHDEGLAVVRAMGTDELHVIGDWRRVFPAGRGVTEVKVKDTYTTGTNTHTITGEKQE